MPYSKIRNRFYPTLREEPWRFWNRIKVRGDCWVWTGCLSTQGYGRAGKREYAHRMAFEMAIGPIPPGRFVCHTCDNPPCCNPAHLFLGDAAANAQDMATKGRVGGGCPPQFDWSEARRLVGRGLSYREVGRRLGVSHGAVSAAVKRAS